MKKVDISISIVSMNNLHDLIVCTNSILKYTQDINSEILINAFRFAENNYNELLAEYSANPMINIQRTDGIKGYSENHNANLLLAKGDVFCILNDDTYINQNIIKESYYYLKQNEKVGALCPILLNWDGSFQVGYRRKFTPIRFILMESKIGRLFPKLNFDMNGKDFYRQFTNKKVVELNYGTGACFFIKKKALRKGLLSTDFFLSPDDINWAYELGEQGYKIVLLTYLKIYHKGHNTLNDYYPYSMPAEIQGFFDLFKKQKAQFLSFFRLLEIFFCLILFLYNFVCYNLYKKKRFLLLYKGRLNSLKVLLGNYGNSKDVFHNFFIS